MNKDADVSKVGQLISDKIVSNETALVGYNDLVPGEYSLTEIKALDSYIINDKVIECTIAKENQGEVKQVDLVKLVNYRGTVKLRKTIENSKPLAGVTFKL